MTAWDDLARSAGPKSVMSLSITDAELNTETERQWPIIADMIRPLLSGSEQLCLDFGAGYGRFTAHLADLTGATVLGYDPCKQFVATAALNRHPRVQFTAKLPLGFEFDAIFICMVLGDPGADPRETAAEIASLLAPDGLLIVLDHMPDEPPAGRWWQFRNADVYGGLFHMHGIDLRVIGELDQLDNRVTVMATRWIDRRAKGAR